MKYSKRYEWMPQYEQTCNTKNGPRYRRTGTVSVAVVRMIASTNDESDMRKIAILSDQTGQPVIYDFEASPQTVSIEVASVAHL